jgi:hypothetical protein
VTSRSIGKHAASGFIWNAAINGGSNISIVFENVSLHDTPAAAAAVLVATSVTSFKPGRLYVTGMIAFVPLAEAGLELVPNVH